MISASRRAGGGRSCSSGPTSLNWVARRSGDAVGREAALLAEPALTGVWEVLGCPYRAFASHGGDAGLLMDDLSDHLLPDIDEPIAVADEDALLSALAALHARYWESDVLRLPWLAAPAVRFALLGPMASTEEARRPSPDAFFDDVRRGWEMAFSRLPPHVKDLLSRPASVLAADCAGLPWTLLHGDAKVANFALLPGRRVAAFDWQLLGVGPATLDLGWYLAVNAGRLARPKEHVIARYRDLLESHLTRPLSNLLWERMVSVGVLSWRADAAVGKGAQPGGVRIAARCGGVELVGHPAQAPRVIIRNASPRPAECRDEERNIQ